MSIVSWLMKRRREKLIEEARQWFPDILKADPPPRQPTRSVMVKRDLDGTAFGMRCYLARGGNRYRPIGLNDGEIEQRATEVCAQITDRAIWIRAAEDVIMRHGLVEEYQGQVKELTAALGPLVSPDREKEQSAVLRAMTDALKRGADPDGEQIRLMAEQAARQRQPLFARAEPPEDMLTEEARDAKIGRTGRDPQGLADATDPGLGGFELSDAGGPGDGLGEAGVPRDLKPGDGPAGGAG